MNEVRRALAGLDAALERARQALDLRTEIAAEAEIADDIRGLLGALHHLVRRYDAIIEMRGDRRRRARRR